MNGIHDMGGMHGMGAIQHEKNEPVFHEPWEGRVYAMTRTIRAGGGRQNLDNSRYQIELLPPADYLRMSYYERWLARLVKQLVTNGVVTREELESGHAAAGLPKEAPRVMAAAVPEMVARRSSARRDAAVAPTFAVGQPVRARNINPIGHTRLPRYARGKHGLIQRLHGAFDLPDALADGRGERPEHCYSVRLDAAELWGDSAEAADAIYLDLWESYLEPA